MFIKRLLISGIILFTLDFIYITINKEWYRRETEKSFNEKLELNWFGVFLRYLSQIVGLNLYILGQNGTSLDAMLFGFIIYGNYIGTNYATVSYFDEKLASVDIIKGGIIMLLTTYLTNKII
jgi:uncharacterized membrane protein